MEIFTAAGFTALLQVIAIDLVLAGDNAIVIGLAAAGLPAEQRKKAILVGIIAATVMRIGFALITQWLLQIGPFLLIAGGALLATEPSEFRSESDRASVASCSASWLTLSSRHIFQQT